MGGGREVWPRQIFLQMSWELGFGFIKMRHMEAGALIFDKRGFSECLLFLNSATDRRSYEILQFPIFRCLFGAPHCRTDVGTRHQSIDRGKPGLLDSVAQR